VTTNQVLAGVGLILVLAVGSQVLASRLRIPALIILLSAGFIAGAVTTDVNPQRLLGAAFQPLVSLSVAVMLHDAGLVLDLRKLHGHTRRIVTRLIVVRSFVVVATSLPPEHAPLRLVTIVERCLPLVWTGSWTGAQDNPSAASAVSAMIRVICAGSAYDARGRTSCKRQASGSNPVAGSQVRRGFRPCWRPDRQVSAASR
jgi:hypothetical protein